MDYNKIAKEIINCVGGKENITGAMHCATTHAGFMTTQKSVYMVFDFFCLNSVAMDFYLIGHGNR